MQEKKVEKIDGYTLSVWKSLVVKSLRIGWIAGMEEANKRMSKSDMNTLCIRQLFEDTFPCGYEELEECYHLIIAQDWEKLLSIDTHHGKGYSEEFCNLEKVVCGGYAQSQYHNMLEEIKNRTSIKWINPNISNCVMTWMKIRPNKKQYRKPMHEAFKGIPYCIFDGHTYEQKGKMLLLSGHYENHRIIGRRVQREGWEKIRTDFLSERTFEPIVEQPTLF